MVRIPTKLKDDKSIVNFIEGATENKSEKSTLETQKKNKKQPYKYESGSRCTINFTDVQIKFFEDAMKACNYKKYNLFIDNVIIYAEKTNFNGENYIDYLPIAHNKGVSAKKICYYKNKPSNAYLQKITSEWRDNWYNVGIKGAVLFMVIHYLIHGLNKKITINEERVCTII
ncbi:hypothetical protein [Pasteurella multocida]|uniref:hypothetical protein n=1 Tax=Pasteurella multocida TaxID=747 RepID=UPI00147B64B1|nr:hypothetical protein [Pasteurella multocida]NNH97746.1 hypothetical protein [Pasteurella multocida]NNI42911.1 hypothetical protein [Pasteurella multocida]